MTSKTIVVGVVGWREDYPKVERVISRRHPAEALTDNGHDTNDKFPASGWFILPTY